MLWNTGSRYYREPFETEADLESAIAETAPILFGATRLYLAVKKKIGAKGSIKNIPDGYLLDLTSNKEPRLYVVEVELAKHEPLKHIAVQVLEFSLSFETSPTIVKTAVRSGLVTNPAAMQQCSAYAAQHGFENVDVLLEKMVYGDDHFNALVIIDEVSEDLETVLISRFQFPVEILTLERYRSVSGERLYHFEPFLAELGGIESEASSGIHLPTIDPAEIDTIVVPAREEGFQEVFLGEHQWWAIRIHASMIPRIKYIAAYRTAPTSAITHIATVQSIKQFKDTRKYIVTFAAPAEPIGPIRLVPKGSVRAPQGPRYTSRARLVGASSLDVAF